MATSWFSCQRCSTSDQTQDTVKVDPNLFNKENVQPLDALGCQLAKKDAEGQRLREAEEKAARRQKEKEAAVAASWSAGCQLLPAAEAARLREEAERAAAERVRREELVRREAEATRNESLKRAAAERASEEEAARNAAAAAAAAAEELQRQKASEEQAELARKEAEEKINAWCKSNGFQDMNTQKKTLRGATKFPLHTAVKYSNQEIIGMMLIAGVQTDVRDSNKQTPCQLAAKLNKDGSHGQILTMLC